MKKIIATMLCLIIFVFSVTVSSGAFNYNYCSEFEEVINSLRWWIDTSVQITKDDNFPADTVLYYTFNTFDIDEYGEEFIEDENEGYYKQIVIPTAVFEERAQNCFKNFSTEELRQCIYEVYDETLDEYVSSTYYNPERNAYIFQTLGGFGDSGEYKVEGYLQEGNDYLVYSNFVEPIGESFNPEMLVEGKDYFIIDGEYYEYRHSVKTVISFKNGEFQFSSWERCIRPSDTTGFIFPHTTFEDNSSLDTTTSSETQTTISSKPSDTLSSDSTDINTTTSSDLNSTNSEQTNASSVVDTTVTSSETTVSREPQNVNTSSKEGNISSQKPQNIISSKPTSSKEQNSSLDDEYKILAQIDTAKAEASDGTFPKGTVVLLEEIKDTVRLEKINASVLSIASKFIAYEITAKNQNISVTPNGKVRVTFNVPEDFDLQNTAVYYLTNDGNTELIESKISEENRTIAVELSHFSTYILAEKTKGTIIVPEKNPTTTPTPTEKDSGTYLWLVILVSVVIVLGGGFMAFYFLYFKKRERKTD